MRSVWRGGLVWLAFSVIAVAVRGVRWEENYEFAQILLGWIQYPEGHPVYQHTRNAFSLQAYLTAAVMRLYSEPWLACGLRNVLYLLAKILPFYLLGAFLTKRTSWGHVCALAAFFVGQGFTRAYPTLPWPMFAGNGVVGMGFALTALALLCMGNLRTAFIIVGLMPALHIGQCPPIMAVAFLYGLVILKEDRREDLRKILSGLAIGGAGSVAALGIWFVLKVALPEAGPYVSDIDPGIVWRGYLEHYAAHRGLGIGKDQIVLVWMLFLGFATVFLPNSGTKYPSALRWVAAYGFILAVTVWAIMLVHYAMGVEVPYVLISWMPYRLPNHLAPLLVTLMVVVIAGKKPFGPLGLVPLVAIALTSVGPDGEHAFTFLSGSAAGAIWFQAEERPWPRHIWLLLSACAWHQFHLAGWVDGKYFVYGIALAIVLHQVSLRKPTGILPLSWRPRLVHGFCVVVVGIMLLGQWQTRDDRPAGRLGRSEFDQNVKDYLTKQGDPNAMICVPNLQWRLQATLGFPVITDAATLTWIPYHPSLGPTLDKLYSDLYEIRLTPEGGKDHTISDWQAVWSGRSAQEWRALGQEYNFRHVWTPTHIELDLPVGVDDKDFRLYTIPAES